MTDEERQEEIRALLAQAFQAILKGDYAERDRLCALAKSKAIALQLRAGEYGAFERAMRERPIRLDGGVLIEGPDGIYRPQPRKRLN